MDHQDSDVHCRLSTTDGRPARTTAALVSLGLSALFVVVYTSTNWFTSQRSDVGTWYYEWERWIPFVPIMIVPYMSIDLFFVAAPFVCGDRRELKLLTGRIALAIALAGIGFLLFPLTLAVERPAASGVLGPVFDWFRGVDLPNNLCPSLHIALRTILVLLYVRHTFGLAHGAVHVWFSLIGLSTLLTYQHHVVDVIGGFLLATVCFYLVRSEPWRLPCEPNRDVGALYGLGAACFAAVALTLRSWWHWLLWPAIAMALAAAACFWLGAGIFGKRNGRLPLSTRLVMGPVLIGQQLSHWYYRHRSPAWNAVTDHVWIGRLLSTREARLAMEQGVKAVLDLTVAFDEVPPLRDVIYHHIPILDLCAPTPVQLDEAVAFIEAQARDGVVYVHCKAGYSRSATVVGAYLLATHRVHTSDEAIDRLRQARPAIIIRPEVRRALEQFAARHSAETARAGDAAASCT